MATAPTAEADRPRTASDKPVQNTRNTVRFLLGLEPVQVALDDPNLTLLEYLRVTARLTGTKEGCAEGDCGACTVLIGECQDGRIHYSAANACILLLGMVDGRQVVTVEHLADSGPNLIQQAMADQHASQCGFCTPGFVMSITALKLSLGEDAAADLPNRALIDENLAGNLCRCTGYGPIIEAARQACAQPLPVSWQAFSSTALAVLAGWQQDPSALHCQGRRGLFAAPRSTVDLLEYLSEHPQATVLAGATDIGLWITKQGRQLPVLLYLGQLPELKSLKNNSDTLEIGATVTIQETQPVLAALSPDLARLLCRFGSRQVRNVATVGGNIANGSPVGDLPPALIALGARLKLQGHAGQREIALEDFFVDYGQQDLLPGEFLASVIVPLKNDIQFYCWKVSKRFDQDISAVLGAFAMQIETGSVQRARICFGGMAATPRRAYHCEAALKDQPLDRQTLDRARDALERDFEPISDLRASSGYRQRIAGNLLEKAFLSMTGAQPAELYDGFLAPGHNHD